MCSPLAVAAESLLSFGTSAKYPYAASTIKLLLSNGADPTILPPDDFDRSGGSCIHSAAVVGDAELVAMLLDHGADIEHNDSSFGTPLQAACTGDSSRPRFINSREVVQVLLRRGANINAIGGWYGSPLGATAAFGKVDIACLLLEAGANANGNFTLLPKFINQTPLEWAVERREVSMVQLLTKHVSAFTAERWELSYSKLWKDLELYKEGQKTGHKMKASDFITFRVPKIERDEEILRLLEDWRERVTEGTNEFPSYKSFKEDERQRNCGNTSASRLRNMAI